jgi:orotidine-5'-phosphate decarboxylase
VEELQKVTFTDRLRSIQHKKDALVCVGLDVDLAKLPSGFKRTAKGALSFLYAIIESTYDLVSAYKPNLAFFEALGPAGFEILHQVVSFIPQNIMTIGDAKRGDIGNTAEHYAKALFDDLHFDAVTVNPYMGKDSVTPFLRKDKGIFLLSLTSNPGSADFQKKKVGRTTLFETVIRTAKKWDSSGSLGYVVGATHPSQLRKVRSLVPDAPLLLPGVGSQGADVRAAVRYGCTRKGDLAVINASRSILYASKKKDFALAARRETSLLRLAIEEARDETFS